MLRQWGYDPLTKIYLWKILIGTKNKEAVGRTEIMALGTLGEEGSWVSPVHFERGEIVSSRPNAAESRDLGNSSR